MVSGADEGVFAEVPGGAVDKLVAADEGGLDAGALPLHKGFGGIEGPQAAAAAHKVEALHPSLLLFGGENLPNNVPHVGAGVKHKNNLPLRCPLRGMFYLYA